MNRNADLTPERMRRLLPRERKPVPPLCTECLAEIVHGRCIRCPEPVREAA